MLDPITAVSVAAATVQFLDFTRNVFLIGHEAYGSVHGTTADLVHLDEVYSHLGALSHALSQSLSTNSTNLTAGDKVLGIANSCHRDCELLKTTLDKVREKSGSKNVYKSFQHALAVIWKQKTIATIETRLDRYRRELTLAVVASLSDGQSALTRGLQSLVADTRRLELSQKAQIEKIEDLFEDIKNYQVRASRHKLHQQLENEDRLKAEKERIFLGHIDTGQQSAASSQMNAEQSLMNTLSWIGVKYPVVLQAAFDMVRYQRLLRSLYFPQINVRHSRIEVAHERTFKWLFQEPSKRSDGHSSKQRFVKWLRSGEGIFWISGKPGSGKSTLMKWIAAQQKTKEALEEWANPTPDAERNALLSLEEPRNSEPVDKNVDKNVDRKDLEALDVDVRVLTASFYFWSAGTSMQKSQEGLFQSLLYEMFSNAPDLMQYACPQRWHTTQIGSFQEPWTIEEISETILRAIKSTRGSIKFCFFVDGIDEYSGDHSTMIKLLKEFSQLPGVKLCVSSRPWNIFEDAFGNNSKKKFYLQDLTRGDIEQYVRSKLRAHPAWKALVHTNTEYNAIASEIQSRADGVFLWVFLVVRSLLDGLTNGDTLSILKDRLARIPDNLQEFFRLMLHSLDPVYNSHIAHFFLAAMDSPDALPLTMFAFFEAEFENPRYIFELDMAEFEPYHIIAAHKQTERRLNGRCKGLLESYRDQDGLDLFRYRVGFLHRTVRDYFLTAEMRGEFEANLPEGFHVSLSLVKACIAMMKKMPKTGEQVSKTASFNFLVDFAFQNLRKAEALEGSPATRLVDELSYVLEQVGFLEDCWQAPGGNHNDMFLGLAIRKGLFLYVSQQLRYWAPDTIASMRLDFGHRRRSLLSCALAIDWSSIEEDFDVSDVVLLLLKNGCDPNETLSGKTLFSIFLHHLDKRNKPTLSDIELESYPRILKHLLAHGADPNQVDDETEYPVWEIFANRTLLKGFCTAYPDFYLELLNILLMFGANPNQVFKKQSPFERFLNSVAADRNLRYQSSRQEVFASYCTALLDHGANTDVRVYSGLTSKSVSDIIGNAFRPSLAGPILAALPVPSSVCTAQLGQEASDKTLVGEFERVSIQTSWSPLAWVGVFNPLRLFRGLG